MNRAGIGHIVTTDRRASEPEFVFSYDKIRKRRGHLYEPYRGESVRELGFKEGTPIAFSETEDGAIATIELDAAAAA